MFLIIKKKCQKQRLSMSYNYFFDPVSSATSIIYNNNFRIYFRNSFESKLCCGEWKLYIEMDLTHH